MERFSLKKLNEVEGKEQSCVEISDGFAALENLDTEVESLKKKHKHKPWFDEGCSELIRSKETSQIAVVTGSKRNKWE
jgi:hypothetical protein